MDTFFGIKVDLPLICSVTSLIHSFFHYIIWESMQLSFDEVIWFTYKMPEAELGIITSILHKD